MATLFLAAKIEENPRKTRDVVNVFAHIAQLETGRELRPMEYYCEEFLNYKGELIATEKHVLKELGFNVHVQHPHKLVLSYLNVLKQGKDMAQRAWSYLNDSFCTNVSCRYHPHVVACAAILLAARDLGIKLPDNPPWWTLFDALLSEIEDVGRNVLFVSSRQLSRTDLPITEKLVEEYLARLKNPQDKKTNGDLPGGQTPPVSTPMMVDSPQKSPPPPGNREGDDHFDLTRPTSVIPLAVSVNSTPSNLKSNLSTSSAPPSRPASRQFTSAEPSKKEKPRSKSRSRSRSRERGSRRFGPVFFFFSF